MRIPFFALCASAFVLAATSALAQTPEDPPRASRMLGIGGGFAGGASMLLDPADNWKVSPVFSWRGTLDVNYPFSKNIGAWLSLGLDRRGGEFYWYNNETVSERRMVNYLSVMPAFNFKGVLVGLNIGFPMSGSRTYRNGIDAEERTIDLDPTFDKLSMMIEPRLGGVITLIDEPIGMLGLTLSAGYNFGEISEHPGFMPGELPDKTFTTENASAHLGVTWLFGIPGTAM